MKRIVLFLFLILLLPQIGRTQITGLGLDSISFNKQLEIAKLFVESEFYNQLAADKFSKTENITSMDWFSFNENNLWHTVGGITDGTTFRITKHVTFDSLNTISDFNNIGDTSKLLASGLALAQANTQFQLIRDTCNLYFTTFIYWNADKTVSVWFLPALQPSGQAIYGVEWEYVYDIAGKQLLKQQSYVNKITGVWIGEPRELWLNYRNTDKPPLGAVFFAQSFHDYFTRIRIDTQTTTYTIAKNSLNKYIWTYKSKQNNRL